MAVDLILDPTADMEDRIHTLEALMETRKEGTDTLLRVICEGDTSTLSCAECQARLPLYLATQGAYSITRVAQDPKLQAVERHLESCPKCRELHDWLIGAAKLGLEPGNERVSWKRLVSLEAPRGVTISWGSEEIPPYGERHWAEAQEEIHRRWGNHFSIGETRCSKRYTGTLRVTLKRTYTDGLPERHKRFMVTVNVQPGERIALVMEKDRQTGEKYPVLIAGSTRRAFRGQDILEGFGKPLQLHIRGVEVTTEDRRGELLAYMNQGEWVLYLLFDF